MLANHHKQDLIEHLIAVSQLACAMAKNLGLPDNIIECVRGAGLLHDIGKALKSFQDYIQHAATEIPPDDSDPTQEFENILPEFCTKLTSYVNTIRIS